MGLFDKFNKRKASNKRDELIRILSDGISAANDKLMRIGPVIIQNQRPYSQDYGLSEKNPILTASLADTERYLSKLRTKDGRSFTWSDHSSVRTDCNGAVDVGEDKYTLYLDGRYFADLYFVLYIGQSNCPPYGLCFVDDFEQEAVDKGITVEQLMEIKRRLQKEAVQIQKTYPTFELSAEMSNKLFEKLAYFGFDLLTTYEYIHREEMFTPKNTIGSYCQKSLSSEEAYQIIIEIEKARGNDGKYTEQTMEELIEDSQKLGISIEMLREIRRMEKANIAYKWQTATKQFREWADQAVEVNKKYPAFNLKNDYANPDFVELLSVVDMLTAYELIHFHELFIKISLEKEETLSLNQPLFCRKCGKELIPDSLFCDRCGTKVLRD